MKTMQVLRTYIGSTHKPMEQSTSYSGNCTNFGSWYDHYRLNRYMLDSDPRNNIRVTAWAAGIGHTSKPQA